MGQSSCYPIHLGRTFAFALKTWREDHTRTELYKLSVDFAKGLFETLPPPGERAPEAWSHKDLKLDY